MSFSVGGFKLEYQIINESNTDMVIKYTGGLGYILDKRKDLQFSTSWEIVVSMSGVRLENLLIEPSSALTPLDEEILRGLKKHMEEIVGDKNTYFYRNHSEKVIARIPMNPEKAAAFADKYSDGIHSELLGFTLYNGRENLNKPCMSSPGYVMTQLCNTAKERSKVPDALHTYLFVNDPYYVYRPLFTNLLGGVKEIPTLREKGRNAGLYVGFSNNDNLQRHLFYTFGDLELDPKCLETYGIFLSRAECEQGGNTERFLSAENRSKELSKELSQTKDKLFSATNSLGVLESNNAKLVSEMTTLKNDHKSEIHQLKFTLTTELNQLRHHTKLIQEMGKYEDRVKEAINKNNIDGLKQKAAYNWWGDLAKAVNVLAGVGFTGYKLLTS